LKLEQELFNRIVDVLWPRMDAGNRQTLITPAFMSYGALYSQIDWSGAPREFSVRLVQKLLNYGEVEVGELALTRLLQTVRAEVGISGQQEIDELLVLLAEAQAQQASPPTRGGGASKSMEDLLREQREKSQAKGPTRGGDIIYNINTGGGAYIGGSAEVGGDLVGRDQTAEAAIGPDDGLESTRGGVQPMERIQPKELRLDTAVPEQVEYQRSFPVAVAVRRQESEKLRQDDLPKSQSGPANIVWPSGAPFVRLRVEISAPDCSIEDEASHSFQLFQNHDSPIFYFWLKPNVDGPINIVVKLYQEQDVLGSTLAKTTVTSERVGQVAIRLNEPTVVKPHFVEPPSSGGLDQDKFKSFDAKMALVKALLACSTVSDHNTRNTIVNNLPDEIRTRIGRSNIDHVDVMNIVNRVLDYPEGLANFLVIVRFYEGETIHMRGLD